MKLKANRTMLLVALAVIIVIMTWRPTGLIAEKSSERV